MKYTINVRSSATGYIARAPEIPGCFVEAASITDAVTALFDKANSWDHDAPPIKSIMKQAIIIRKDLKLRRGKEIAQGAHASVAVTVDNQHDPRVIAWLSQSFAKITLQVESEEEFLSIVEKAKDAGIPAVAIRDHGHTEFHGVPTYVAAAIGPDTREAIDAICGHLKLY